MPLSEEERRCDDIVTEAQPHIAMTGTYDEVQDYFAAGGLSDGLPIVPPTEEKVAEMLSGTRRARDEVVTTRMFPEELTVTVEKVAIVGAMAGCQPGHMPVLLSLVNNWGSNPLFGQAVRSDSTFNLMIVVNGPIRREIDMNQGSNAMGPGNRANASIGRFLRLAIICLGGSIPGANDLSAQGNPVKYGFCFPENEEESPWEPFHVSQGFGANESVVSLWAGGWCFWSLCADLDLLARAFGSFPQTGGALLMSLEAARLYNGLKMSKADVEQYVLEHAHQQLFDQQPTWYKVDMPPINRLSPSASPTAIPSDGLSIKIIVVGGETSIPIAQAWHFNPATSTPVDNWR